MKKLYKILTIVILCIASASAQIIKEETPISFKTKKSLKTIKINKIVLPKFDSKQENKQENSRKKTIKFAHTVTFDIDFLKEATKIDLDTAWLYLLQIESKGAKSLSVNFSEYYLAKTSKLFLYNKDKSFVFGALTPLNNKKFGSLAVSPIKGDKIILEYFHPKNIKDDTKLKINKINHAFLDIYDLKGTKTGFGVSGSCNVNINCTEGNNWQDEKNSVVRLIVNGNEFGTGSLINNTANNGIPYIFSANHMFNNNCENLPEIFNSTIALFNYESPNCEHPASEPSKNNSVSGAELVATPSDCRLDFALIKLTKNIPASYNPFFAGWELSDTPHSPSVTIHHPSADIKKISVDYDYPIIDTYDSYYNAYTHWRIAQWEVGTTEGGSSGSPLFNEHKRIIGTLTGGEASCNNSVNDYYQNIYHAWEYKADINQQLKHWLDPTNSGVTELGGNDTAVIETPSSGIENELCIYPENYNENADICMYPIISKDEKLEINFGNLEIKSLQIKAYNTLGQEINFQQKNSDFNVRTINFMNENKIVLLRLLINDTISKTYKVIIIK